MASENITETQVKNFIKGLLTSNSLISTIQSVQKDYFDLIGSPIPYRKFNYNSVEHFLKSIPDTCVVNGSGPYAQVILVLSEKSAHINQMVTQQKVNIKGKRNFVPRRRTIRDCVITHNSVPPPRRESSNNYAISPNSSSSSSSMGCYSNPLQAKQTNNNYTNSNLNDRNSNSTNNIDQTNRNASSDTRKYDNCKEEENTMEKYKAKEKLDRLIQQQLEAGNVAIRLNSSTAKSTETESQNIPKNDSFASRSHQRYLNISNNEPKNDYLKEASEVYQDNCLNNSRERLKNFLLNLKEEEEAEDMSNVPEKVQNYLKTLIGQFNDGIWSSDLPDLYKKQFNKELHFMDYGYTSLIEMCIALKHIFHYVRPGNDDFKLYDRSKPLPHSLEKLYTIASFDKGKKIGPGQALPELEWSDFKGHIPDDVFPYGNEIPTEFFPPDTKSESTHNIVVVEVYDPSKFWIQLGTSDLDALMDQLQAFYENRDNAKKYAVPPGAVKVGLYCVQVVIGEFHRGRIVRTIPDDPDHVTVFYIDYGTVCKSPVKGMCFLHSKFAELKAQAVRCRLSNIYPTVKGHPWPRSASDRLRQLVSRRDTKIKVTYIDWNEEFVCVFLADVTNKKNIKYVNEILVNEGHALWENQKQTVPLILSQFKCTVQNLHLFPTFVELECGMAPSAVEMLAMEEAFFPIHFCIPKYFVRDEQMSPTISQSQIQQIEDCFLSTVINKRKYTPLIKLDMREVLKPPTIDFDLFGDLKQEMIEFCESMNLTDVVDRPKDVSLPQDTSGEDLANDDTVIKKCLKRIEPLQLHQEEKQTSESKIENPVGKYSLLSFNSSSSDLNGRNLFGESWKVKLGPADGSILFNKKSDIDPNSPSSPTNPFMNFLSNQAPSRSEVNIFDNPEEFEDSSDKSDDDINRPTSPESFLKKVEAMCSQEIEEEMSLLQNCSSEGATVKSITTSDVSLSFDLEPGLKEAYRTFLESQKPRKKSDRDGSFLTTVYSDLQADGTADCEGSFLKHLNGKDIFEKVMQDLDREDAEINKNNFEEIPESFLSTLGPNNPFRSYFETKSEKTPNAASHEDNTRVLGAGKFRDTTQNGSKTTDVDLRNLSMETSDSDSSDYKSYVPREGLAKNISLETWVKSTVRCKEARATSSGILSPADVESPPRIFTPPVLAPSGFPPYPQWSNESGFPIPQNPRWNPGFSYGYPGPFYPRSADVRVPSSFAAYPCPPPQFAPHFNPCGGQRFAPMYPPWLQNGTCLQPSPRPAMPHPSIQKDFYDRYNANIMSKNDKR